MSATSVPSLPLADSLLAAVAPHNPRHIEAFIELSVFWAYYLLTMGGMYRTAETNVEQRELEMQVFEGVLARLIDGGSTLPLFDESVLDGIFDHGSVDRSLAGAFLLRLSAHATIGDLSQRDAFRRLVGTIAEMANYEGVSPLAMIDTPNGRDIVTMMVSDEEQQLSLIARLLRQLDVSMAQRQIFLTELQMFFRDGDGGDAPSHVKASLAKAGIDGPLAELVTAEVTPLVARIMRIWTN